MKLRAGIVLLGLLFGCQALDGPEREGPYPVLRIIDGDTIVLLVDGKPERVRLIGVDTPETVHPSRPVERFGQEAAAFTTRLMEGQEVMLGFDYRPRDRYGRLLAYVYRASDGLFVNLEIIRQGYGHAYTRFPFRYLEPFREAEQEAREAGRGLWAQKADGEAEENTGTEQAGPEQIVYVTRSGTRYHRDGCRHLAGSRIEMTLEVACERYGPCGVCKPPVLELEETR